MRHPQRYTLFLATIALSLLQQPNIGLSQTRRPFSPNTIQTRVTAGERSLPSYESQASKSASLAAAESMARAFRSASNTILPSVVKIRTTSVGGGKTVMLRGVFPMEIPQREQEGLGSGVIIDSSGIIMTNNHVVKDATEIVVVLQDGTELQAEQYTTDPMTDLAVVRVSSARPLPAARLGDSDALKVGDWVLAVGHPLELETSVSAGIISAKGRSLKKIPRAQFLQTDAAINPGNSGGPLINLRGEVVGINTAIASQTGGYQGIGFAVPANLAQDIVRQLLESGRVTRAYLGVNLQKLTKDLAAQLTGSVDVDGVLVSHVKPDTPASRAGLAAGDVITQFANTRVDSPSALQRAVEQVPIGSTQRLRMVRFGNALETDFTTALLDRRALGISQEAFEKTYGSVTRQLAIPVKDNSTFGFQVADLESYARNRGYNVDGNAVIITKVARSGLAAEEGLVPGMIIKQVRDQPINSVAEFREALKGESLGEGVLLLVLHTRGEARSREQVERFVVLRSY